MTMLSHPAKSLPFLRCFAFLLLFVLTGCADARWPSWLSGEPDRTASPATPPEGLSRVGVAPSYWPKLQEIPVAPSALSNSATTLQQLEQEREQSLRLQQQILQRPTP